MRAVCRFKSLRAMDLRNFQTQAQMRAMDRRNHNHVSKAEGKENHLGVE